MRRKVGIICLLVCMLGMCFWWSVKTDNNISCTLKVETSYSGYGIDGQELGSGTFADTFIVSAGDEFYEWYNGHWNKENKKSNNSNIILSIKKIDNNGIVVQVDGEEMVLKYDTIKSIKSTFVIFDGTNFEHSICFTKEIGRAHV